MGRIVGHTLATIVSQSMHGKRRSSGGLEETLFLQSAGYLGWPVKPLIAWLYPTVHRVEKNGSPALITFYPNPAIYIDLQRRHDFERYIQQQYPGHWKWEWVTISQGYITAEHLEHSIHVKTGENSGRWVHFASYDSELLNPPQKRRFFRSLFRGLFRDEWRG